MRFALLVAAFVVSACAKTIVITVGGNTTSDPGAVFNPQTVVASAGDVVMFNFTQGNHTATQSTFASPCTAVHFTNSSINGFDTSFRDTHNGTAITQFTLPITDNTTTIWFFDWNTCPEGGVGGINLNDSSLETLEGITRNAIRLNGTGSSSSSSSASHTGSSTQSATSPTSSANNVDNSSSADRAVVLGLSGVLPALAMLLALSL
ncbi:hypothetical protein JR316_0002419 [Psilocybe cubensis]|uniref:Phytocyanin domain-containing protein n=2 Tax=Psilocybe cubensis TaxID=181762 RepID=A0A8H7Y5P8_PSICU|nr:hypothetical protein JR316_0002419 [Psilocybe cubensis]KAH9485511.1 hypothetical protein JR316_0002419 [Psilocybe cubensis]